MTIRLKNATEFKRILMEKGFSYRSLAEVAKLSYVSINDIANEKKRPTPKTAKRICEALDLEFQDIFFIVNDNN